MEGQSPQTVLDDGGVGVDEQSDAKPHDAKAKRVELVSEAGLVGGLQQARPQMSMHLDAGADDALGPV